MSRFAPGWGMTLACLVLVPALLALGVWQIERGAEKTRYQDRYLDRIGQPPQAVPASLDGSDFFRVHLTGEYLAGEHYLVDNRVREGRPGYWVVSRFGGDDGRIYLVNRGWLEAPPSREQLPRVATPAGPVRLVGVLWPDMGQPPLLGPDPWAAGWPKRVQRLDLPRMAGGGSSVVPVEVRLEPGVPGVLEAAPLAVDFRPERHRGYAVQWFALAVVLAVGYVMFGLRRS